MKKAFLLLNGEPPKQLPDLTNYYFICATDGAYQYLKKNNIKVDLLCGDFDSIDEIPTDIEVINTPNQDFTDFEKALKIVVEKGFTKVDVYGASAKEQDHFLGNLNSALVFKHQLIITFFDDYQRYFLAKSKEKIKLKKGSIVSLVPFPKAKNIITKGLQYPLHKEDLVLGKRIGTRNMSIANEIEISFESGELFIFIENDNE